MRIFVTGASGWIGSAVVPELISSGHHVVGLARSDESARSLVEAGVEVERGSLDDLNLLGELARASDGVIHLAFKHDLAFGGDFLGAATADRRAVETFADALAGTDRPLVLASGLLGLTPGALVSERDGHVSPDVSRVGPGPLARWATAEFVLSLASKGIRSSIVRLSPTNHGDGDNGFMATLVAIAREKGASGYVGEGVNRWPAVHRLDSAKLFALALAGAPAGATLHAVADEGVPIREVAQVIGRHLNVPTRSVAPEDAAAHFTWLSHFIAMDSPASSAITRELLGWQPVQPGLLTDLDRGHYFQG
ncbi:MAG: 3-beta hydroxysteroid dehydrogenase [Acidimicrobiaceae bacterium]|nr:3-beta hydroxysteroid dehydrogenase [Acidimicrobiaceae bacterium]